MLDQDIDAVVELCRATLSLAGTNQPSEYGYWSLPLCVIDAVFSIGAHYTSTANTVARFCQHLGVRVGGATSLPGAADQLSITNFVRVYGQYGIEAMAKTVYQNRQRTSTRNGILKSEAALLFGQTLQQFGVDYFQDVNKILGNASFESEIARIPGQHSGISLRYFYMLAGSTDYVKPDRMIMRFIQLATGRMPSIQEGHDVVVGACAVLAKDHPRLTPRSLDSLIWRFQRERSKD